MVQSKQLQEKANKGKDREEKENLQGFHGRMARGGHEASTGPAMPSYPSTSCRRATLEKVLKPTGQAACGYLLPLWTPHAVRLCKPFVTLKQVSWNMNKINRLTYGFDVRNFLQGNYVLL
jgi:hypothetical protein